MELPYLITALLGNSMNIVNNNFFINTATAAGSSYEDAKLALGIIQVQCNKLTSIPQVLALGFFNRDCAVCDGIAGKPQL